MGTAPWRNAMNQAWLPSVLGGSSLRSPGAFVFVSYYYCPTRNIGVSFFELNSEQWHFDQPLLTWAHRHRAQFPSRTLVWTGL